MVRMYMLRAKKIIFNSPNQQLNDYTDVVQNLIIFVLSTSIYRKRNRTNSELSGWPRFLVSLFGQDFVHARTRLPFGKLKGQR